MKERNRLTGEQQHINNKMVQAGLSKMSALKAASPPTDGDKVMEKMKSIHLDVIKTMTPIMQESMRKGIHDRQEDKEMLCSLYLQRLEVEFSKEELVFLLTSVVAEQVFEKL